MEWRRLRAWLATPRGRVARRAAGWAVVLLGPLPGHAPLDLILLPFVISLVLVAVVVAAAALGRGPVEPAGGATGAGRVGRWVRLFKIGSRDAVRLLRVPSAVLGA